MKQLKPSYQKIKYQDKEMTLKEWSIELGMTYQTLYHRLRKGYDVDKLFSKDIPRWNPKWLDVNIK